MCVYVKQCQMNEKIHKNDIAEKLRLFARLATVKRQIFDR